MERCANSEALNGYLAKQQSGEEQLEEAQELIECRLEETVEEILAPLIREIEGLDYGLNGRDLVMEHLEAVL